MEIARLTLTYHRHAGGQQCEPPPNPGDTSTGQDLQECCTWPARHPCGPTVGGYVDLRIREVKRRDETDEEREGSLL